MTQAPLPTPSPAPGPNPQPGGPGSPPPGTPDPRDPNSGFYAAPLDPFGLQQLTHDATRQLAAGGEVLLGITFLGAGLVILAAQTPAAPALARTAVRAGKEAAKIAITKRP